MEETIGRQIEALQQMKVKELRQKYAEVFGEETKTGNRAWLIKRVAWRIQALAEGDLSERARARAEELANDADLRLNPPKAQTVRPAPERTVEKPLRAKTDDRLPPPGTILTRRYKGEVVQVKILSNGFEHDGRVHRSLSAVAKAITGSHCNGFAFFGLSKGGSK